MKYDMGCLVERPRLKRCHSWDNAAMAPQIDRTPVRFYLNQNQNCLALLHVRCRDQVGFLFTLSDLVMRHGIDVDRADIATVGKDIDNRMVLRASRPSDFTDAQEWCEELKAVAMQRGEEGGGSTEAAQLAAAASRLSVNPHLLCVSRFHRTGVVQAADNQLLRSPVLDKPMLRYRLELKGINQAGLLAYLSLVLSQSGFSIVRAHIDTADGYVSDMFDLKTDSANAERRLRSFLCIPSNNEVNLSLPELQLLWSGGSLVKSKGMPTIGASSDLRTPLDSPTKIAPPSPQFGAIDSINMKRFELSNGDVYEGDMDDSNQRQGHGMYTYAGGQATYKQYSGQWLDNKKHGFGTLIFRDGSAYVGQWKASKRHGIGVYFGYGEHGASGPGAMPMYRYEGEWAADQQSGIGVEETEEYLYCGHFTNGYPCGKGLKIQLRVPGLSGCAVLQGETWTPLLDALRGVTADAAPDHSSRQKSGPFNGLGKPGEEETLLTSAQTFHFGASSSAAAQTGLLSNIAFEAPVKEEEEEEDQPAPLPAMPVERGGASAMQGFLARIATPGHEARKMAAALTTPMLRSIRGRDDDTKRMVAPDYAPESTNPTPSPPNLRMNSNLQTSEKKDEWEEKLKSVNAKFGAKAAPTPRVGAPTPRVGAPTPSTGRIPNHIAVLASPPKWRDTDAGEPPLMTAMTSMTASPTAGAVRRALTPESKTTSSKATNNVIACPMLWGSEEVTTIIQSIGVGEQVEEKLRGIRLTGCAQLLEMSNAQMSSDLGLSAPLERLTVRRCLQHLTEADRYENSARGRTVLDVMNDTTLKPFIVPLHDLTLVQSLSQGGFGMVYKGTLKVHCGKNEPSVKWVAVKEMLGDQRVRLYECLKEAHVMASLRHKNICKFIGVCTDGKPRGKRYIVSELLDCSLFDLVHRPTRVSWNGTLDIPLTISLGQGICTGLAYIHARNVVHADLKSSNILIDLGLKAEDDYKPVPRICDFGHAAVRTAATPHDRLCTPHWAAPEVLRSEGLGPAADIFSVGVLLWEMLARRVPHCDLGFGQVLAAVGWAGLVPDMALLPPLPEELRCILNTCLSFLPSERPEAKDVKRRLQRLPRVARLEALKMLQGFMGCVPLS
eukprot:CAMPEP_0195132914 /NCGR_PEP_ID=MMETSP0448-20130528/147803_1 /TAXON_ID=66468 /ORGANISM="Heterocapsa triquestra, Strain CCMP 448" /LENGTH=1116 /DNA_ID=CAMNT_0040170945 /DNA_START=169 /DNA_END=3519 /DNA_ORIENTATION=-